MRHRKRSRRLVSKWEHRQALMRNLLNSLFVHERITTTLAKAKELRRVADKMITLAKRGDLHARRQALAVLQNKELVRKLFKEAQERFGDRQGGYTRIVRVGPRRGDAAMMAIVELVAEKLEHKRSKKKIEEDKEALAMAPKSEVSKPAEIETEEAQAEVVPEAETASESAQAEEPTAEASPAEEGSAAEGKAEAEAPAEGQTLKEDSSEPAAEETPAEKKEA